ncbi:organic cation/carnitine transporter 2-like [Mercenaria mercenaria]|uniref:organic cation/carnitine transporter 2-like n=1 Tax=Mercenaria mercenaria TaxID=6596 RepID=UPI00234E5573|nr:organic cation/carnitine transporter 2-like [Mercenaria mercenaria]
MDTVVSEWNLVCDRQWIVAFITSIQMVGVLLGSIIAGQMADSTGRKPTMLTGFTTMLFIIYFSLVPESFRWLVSKMKFEQADRSIDFVANVNRVPKPNLKKLFDSAETEINTPSNTTTEYEEKNHVKANHPSTPKYQIQGSSMSLTVATLVISLLAKMSVSTAYLAITIYTTELYPTVVRTIGYGFQSTVGRIGAVAAPLLIHLVQELEGLTCYGKSPTQLICQDSYFHGKMALRVLVFYTRHLKEQPDFLFTKS